MRLAFVAQPFDRLSPPVQGGSLAIWIYQVAKCCAALGHETYVFANHGDALRYRSTEHETVHFIYTPTLPNAMANRAGGLANRLGLTGGGIPSFAAWWRDIGYGLAVAQQLRSLRCDAVLVMNCTQLVPLIRRVCPRIKIYLYMQCEWLSQLEPTSMRSRMEAADWVSGCSEYITAKAAQRFPEMAHKCVTLHNASVPTADASMDTVAETVLFVGRVSPEKGIHVLLEAFRDVLVKFPSARLRLVGGAGSAPLEYLVGLSDEPQVMALRRFYSPASEARDPYLVHLEREAGAELGKRILFEGRVDYDQTSAAYREAAVLVNPSLSESFGMSLVEAMMHGKPVVATRAGGMPFIVEDGKTGRLVDAANSVALAKAICELLGDPEKARRMGQVGRERALAHFTWQHTAETLVGQLAREARS